MLHERFLKMVASGKQVNRAGRETNVPPLALAAKYKERSIAQDTCEGIFTRLCSIRPMSDIPDEWVFLEMAWRFALLLTGCHEGTSKVFKDSVDELLRHPHPGDLERTRQLFYTIVRRRGLKFPARCELEGTPAKLHKLPEPGRSALALLYLDALPASEIQCVLSLDERLLAHAIDKTRSALRGQRAMMS
jgi:hypothetical protein